MATKRTRSQESPAKELREHAIVSKLVPDPSKPPADARIISCYLGRSVEPGVWRLYSTLKLTDYIEVKESDIIYSDVPSGEDELKPAQVWVRAEATLRHTTVGPQEAESSFLQGEVTNRFMREVMPNLLGGRWKGGTGIVCDLTHTWFGGYTCDVFKRGVRYHDSIQIDPCAYSLGGDPYCGSDTCPSKTPLCKSKCICTAYDNSCF